MSPLGTSTGVKKTATTTAAPAPSTSSVITSVVNPKGTVMVSAGAEETKTTIAALLSLGSDLPSADNIDITAENALLVPINPIVPTTATPKTISKDDDTLVKSVQPVPVPINPIVPSVAISVIR